MAKVVVFVLACAVWSSVADTRQKRLLFYDEEGNLVKTYSNPLRYDVSQNIEQTPFYGNFLKPFFSFLLPSPYRSASAYMIPVSDKVLQEVTRDPIYQNKLILPTRDAAELNPLCANKRGQIPSSKSCSQFVNCWDGWAVEQKCPEGLMFSNDGVCDYPDNVNCGERKIKDDAAPAPSCKRDFQTFINEADCKQFYVCVNRSPVKFQCPENLVYDENLGVCDYEERAGCGSKASAVQLPAFPAAPIPSPAPLAPSQRPIFLPADEPGPNQAPANPANSIIPPGFDAIFKKSVFNSQSFSTSHIALSRQDAIRQLQLKSIANLNTAY